MPRRLVMITLSTLVGALLFLPAPASASDAPAAAHEPGQSYMFLRIHDDSLAVRFEIRVEDLNDGLGFGWDVDAALDGSDLARDLPAVRDYWERHFSLTAGGQPVPLEFMDGEVRFVEWGNFVILTYSTGGGYVIPDEIEITFDALLEVNGDHRDMVIIEYNWKTGTFNEEANIALVMGPNNPTQVLDLTASTTWRGFIAMIWQGVWHILIGFDHILFLMALVLPSVLVREQNEWQPAASFRTAFLKLVAIVTFFTIAHSITLSMAALELFRLPSRIVETIIAASIAAAATANLMPSLNIREWSIAFIFGLFHGFGFATVLGDIGLAREFLVLTLLGFNVGVELGQIAIIALVFPFLYMLRNTGFYRHVFRWGSVLLIVIGVHWALERIFGWDVQVVRFIQGIFG